MNASLPPGVQALLANVANWATENPHISGVVLVGSYARGEPSPTSDVDLVVIAESLKELFSDRSWIDGFGEVTDAEEEDWGKVKSLRVRFSSGLEVEFGITGHHWLEKPIDEGTAAVLRKGVTIVFDREGFLETALAELGARKLI